MADQAFLAMLRASEYGSDDGGGGGATTTASSGNIFEVDSSIMGPGEDTTPGLGVLNFDSLLAKDFKSLLEESSSEISWLFGNIQISAGPLIPSFKLMNELKMEFNILSAKPHTLVYRS